MNKKILITGGSGFIARSVYEHLSNCYFYPLENNVLSLTRKSLDVLDSGAVAKFLDENQFDVVINAATYDPVPDFSTKDSSRTLEMNLKMFFNIVRCKDSFGKMIHFGTGAEFCSEHREPLVKESSIHDRIPVRQYDLAKHIMTEYTYRYDNIYNLRLFGLYGKFDDWRYRFISNACCKVALNRDITIKSNRRIDYLYIDDLVKIIQWVIDNEPQNKVYNACTSKCMTYEDISNLIINISGHSVNINHSKSDHWSDNYDVDYSGDNILLKSDMNFTPLPMDKCISRLYNWYYTNKQIIDPDQFLY